MGLEPAPWNRGWWGKGSKTWGGLGEQKLGMKEGPGAMGRQAGSRLRDFPTPPISHCLPPAAVGGMN